MCLCRWLHVYFFFSSIFFISNRSRVCGGKSGSFLGVFMLDSKLLRFQLDEVVTQLSRRGCKLDANLFKSLEEKRKVLQKNTQELQAQRNQASKAIGLAKSRGEDVSVVLNAVTEVGEKLAANEAQLQIVQKQLLDFQLMIPNLPHASVPKGSSEESSVENLTAVFVRFGV